MDTANALKFLIDPTAEVPLDQTAKRVGVSPGILKFLLPAALGAGGLAAGLTMFGKRAAQRALTKGYPNVAEALGSAGMKHLTPYHAEMKQQIQQLGEHLLSQVDNPPAGTYPLFRDKERGIAKLREMAAGKTVVYPELDLGKSLGAYDQNTGWISYNAGSFNSPQSAGLSAEHAIGVPGSEGAKLLPRQLMGHEGRHAATEANENLGEDIAFRVSREAEDTHVRRGQFVEDAIANPAYAANPTEAYAYINQLRDMFGLRPGESLDSTSSGARKLSELLDLQTLEGSPHAKAGGRVVRNIRNAFDKESLALLLKIMPPVVAGAAAIPAAINASQRA